MENKTYKVSILGASGYTGAELMRLLGNHPNFDISVITAHSYAGKKVSEVYPHLSEFKDELFSSFKEVESKINASGVVFSALPHGESMNLLPSLTAPLIIDLGSDFRLQETDLYKTWYGKEHSCPEEVSKWTYGLPELFQSDVKKAKKIANPGCYPTASALALAPLYKEGLLEGSPHIDAYSGISGAGRTPGAKSHFSHLDENIAAYKLCSHQHTPEIEACLEKYSGKKIPLSFVAHLAPMIRGIHVSASCQVKESVTQKDLYKALSSAYANSKFVSVLEAEGSSFNSSPPPQTKSVRGSNNVFISCYLDERTNRAIILSVIDNLVKGASGQAIQNANIALGLSEDTGLSFNGLYP